MVAVILTLIVSLIRMKELIGSREELRKECQGLSSHLDKLNSLVVFCHNDLMSKNMIYCEEKGTFLSVIFSILEMFVQQLSLSH